MKKLFYLLIVTLIVSSITPSFFISNIRLAKFYKIIGLNFIIHKLHSLLRTYKYFNLNEFDSRDFKNSGWFMNHDFILTLDKIRHKYGKPIKINTGYRTHNDNNRVKGSKKSAHLHGIAVDIQFNSLEDRNEFIKIAFKYGIRRFGLISNTALHIDIGDKVDLNIWNHRIWFYNGDPSQPLNYLVNSGIINAQTFNDLV